MMNNQAYTLNGVTSVDRDTWDASQAECIALRLEPVSEVEHASVAVARRVGDGSGRAG